MNATRTAGEEIRCLQDRPDLGVDDPRPVVVRRTAATRGEYHRGVRDADLRALEPDRVGSRTLDDRVRLVLVVEDTANDALATVSAVRVRPDLCCTAGATWVDWPIALAFD